MTRCQKQRIIHICKQYGFLFSILFGSMAQKSSFSRDYDLAFYTNKKTPPDVRLKIFSELQPLFEKPIDIVIIKPATDPLLAYEIAHKGKLVYERKKESFLQFQTISWKKYLDTERYRKYEQAYIRKKVKDVS